MNSPQPIQPSRSTADVVFDHLFEEIVTLTLLPGTKISEAEVAKRFGVSRQPIRDAFRRLGGLNLLSIRPQRATVVRRFSLDEIQNTRFLRLAIELEVVEHACTIWGEEQTELLNGNLAAQRAAIASTNMTEFHQLDYDFHQLICEAAGRPLAFDMIQSCKRHVDRLCVLSLSEGDGQDNVLSDHVNIAEALADRDTARARAHIRSHAGRLDPVITEIHQAHPDYFQ